MKMALVMVKKVKMPRIDPFLKLQHKKTKFVKNHDLAFLHGVQPRKL
jgi:hypothetical protein